MNTNMTGLDDFQISLCPCALDENSPIIGMVNLFMPGAHLDYYHLYLRYTQIVLLCRFLIHQIFEDN